LTFVCGEYGDWWQLRQQRANEKTSYLKTRLEQLTETLYLLRLSHDRLEQSLLSQPLPLRDALSRLRNLFVQEDQSLPPEAAERFLRLMAQYFQLEVAAVYRFESATHTFVSAASIGTVQPLDLDDALVRYSREHLTLCHLLTQQMEENTRSRYLIVAPLKARDGEILGWFVVEKMPFLALHADALQMMSAFLGYFADSAYAAHAAKTIQVAFPDCPLLFAQELLRLVRLQHECGIESHIVAWTFGAGQRHLDVQSRIKKTRRGLDVLWETTWQGTPMILTLMPFAKAAAVEGYLSRIHADAVNSPLGLGFREAGIDVYSAAFDTRDAVPWLYDFFGRCRMQQPPSDTISDGRKARPRLAAGSFSD
jgi:hypothetical protein